MRRPAPSPSTTRTAPRPRCRSPAAMCKLQWKPDFGMRWYALGVDFEMFGKDHQTNQHDLRPHLRDPRRPSRPSTIVYELFLDEIGQKISKSKGNGLTIDEWLTYASPESLALYMFQKPRVAKRLYFDVIPRAVDDYYQHVAAYSGQDAAARAREPGVPHPFGQGAGARHAGHLRPAAQPRLGRRMRTTQSVLWGFLTRRLPGATAATNPELDRLAGYAVRYFNDEVEPTKIFRAPPTRSAPRCRICTISSRARKRSTPRNCRTSSMRSATRTSSSRCATGSAPSTTCCSAPSRARASARSSRSTVSPKRAS